VGAPGSPVLPTPWTLNCNESPSSPRSLPALTVTRVSVPGTVSSGGWPTKPVPQEEAIRAQDLAGTSQACPWQGAHDTNHPPSPWATTLTAAGAPGPTAVVLKLTGAEDVNCLLM
jgi:hypothetical protein